MANFRAQCRGSRLKHPVYLWKRPIFLKFWPVWRASNLTQIKGPQCNTLQRPQKTVGATFVLSLCLTPSCQISQKGACAHVWHPSFCSCHPGYTPWSPGSGGWGGRDCILGSHGTVAIEEMFLGKLLLLGQCTPTERHTPQSFHEGDLFASPASFGLAGRLQVWHTSSELQSCSQGTQTMDTILVFSLCLAIACLISLIKELIHLSGAPAF